jgi:hypothetical protein
MVETPNPAIFDQGQELVALLVRGATGDLDGDQM